MKNSSLRILACAIVFAAGAVSVQASYLPGVLLMTQQADTKIPEKTVELIRTRIAYEASRASLETLKALTDEKQRLATLMAMSDFADDPLKDTREKFVAVRGALETALAAEPADSTKPAIVDARKRLEEAKAVAAETMLDLQLANEVYTNLAKSLPKAIESYTAEPKADNEHGQTILSYVHALTTSHGGLNRLAKIATQLKSVDPTLETKVDEARTKLNGWAAPMALLVKNATSELDTDNQYLEALIKTPSADWKQDEVSAKVSAARRHRELALLAATALTGAEKPIKDSAEFPPLIASLRSKANQVRPMIEIADDGLGGARNDWEQAAIPVYYFGSVPRLMTVMNLDAERFQNSYFQDIDSGRAALVDAEKTRDLLRGDVARMVSELASIRQKLTLIETKSKLDQLNLDRLTTEELRLTKAIEGLEEGPKKAALEKDKKAVTTHKEALATTLTAEGEEATQLSAEKATLEASAAKTASDLEKAKKTLNQLRLESAALAEREVQGFRKGVERAPFWVSRARSASKDPLKRCEVFGYEDSLVVFVRGSRADLDAVRQVIRALDRPTPQARLTLHTLQYNGSNPAEMRKSAERIEAATTQLRGNLTIVQDVLRSAISKEVNRKSRVARLTIGLQPGVALSDRVYRGFYYPREIRSTLGLRLQMPRIMATEDYVNRLAGSADDMRSAIAAFWLAHSRYTAATQLKDRSSMIRTLGEVEMALTQAVFYFDKADLHGPAAGRVVGSSTYLHDAALQLRGAGNRIATLYRSNKRAEEVREGLKSDLGNGYSTHILNAQNIVDALETEIVSVRSGNNLVGMNPVTRDLDAQAIGRLEFLTQYTLPDPARGTTLGELLFVFSLGGQDSRERILHDFSAELLSAVRGTVAEKDRQPFEDFLEDAQEFFGLKTKKPKFEMQGLAALAVSSVRLYGNSAENMLDAPSGSMFPYFPRTVFGGFSPRDNPGPTTEPMTANQLEILSAIKTRVRAGVIEELKARLDNADGVTPDWQAQTLAAWLIGNSSAHIGEGGGVQTFDTVDTVGGPQDAKNLTIPRLKSYVEAVRVSAGLDEATGRVAAADDMIKRFITVLEDDLQHFLISPTLEEMREAVSTGHVKFGSLQSTSVLAANRGVARFDASAVATLGQDPEAGREALQVAQQLGDLTNTLGGYVGKTGGIAPFAVPFLRSTSHAGTREDYLWKLGGLGLVASALLLPDDNQPPAALYSLTSGGQFKVTPILDPSGQALRFDLDYALTTRVQEPVNHSGTQLPLVERQSMNIPVQVSNLDFRQVAGFEANTHIGLAPQRFGGVPFFKSLPLFKDIPLIGYFARSKGTPDIRQQTYVFVQSSIYPTVSDIVGLLVEAPLRTPTGAARRNP